MESLLLPALVGLLGVLAHILKRARMDGEGLDALRKYLHGHVITIVLTLIGFGVQFAIAYQLETLNLYTAFLAGYLANSIFDRAGKSGGIRLPKAG